MVEDHNNKVLILIHGRRPKPLEADLRRFWFEALGHGIEREYGGQSAEATAFQSVSKKFVYYGDLSNDFFARRKEPYHRVDDTQARQDTLNKLKRYGKDDFTEQTYLAIRGRWHATRRRIYGGFAWLAGVLRLPRWAIRFIMPDLYHYWKNKQPFGPGVRSKMEAPLLKSLEAGQDVTVVAHSLGAIVTYDVLAKATGHPQKLSNFVTIGSPLGISYIQRRLRDWPNYVPNIKAWHNVSAKDDYVSLDREIEDEFEGMAGTRKDHFMFNLAEKDENAHQHHATGYLIAPVVARLVGGWLN